MSVYLVFKLFYDGHNQVLYNYGDNYKFITTKIHDDCETVIRLLRFGTMF